MGLATRIIPTLLDRHAQLVKGRAFAADRVVGHTRQAIRIHQQRGVDELIYLDIAATRENRGPDFDAVAEFADECFMPLTVGGGVRSIEDVRRLLEMGADKIAICTAAVESPRLIEECASRFGSQAIVVAIDARGDGIWGHCGKYAAVRGVLDWAMECEGRGAGEILLTSIDREGTLSGYDLDLIRRVSEAVSIPVIANGGCGKPEHALEAVRAGASAVGIGAMFLFTDETPQSVGRYLQANDVEVRL